MNRDQPSFEFSPAVCAYLTRPEVRAGVDAIAHQRVDRLTANLGWDDLPGYYDAFLAATHVKVEWAKDANRLWQEVWQARIAPGVLVTLDQHIINHADPPDIQTRFSESCFGRVHREGNATIYTYVGFGDMSVYVGGYVERRGKGLKLTAPSDAFDFDLDTYILWLENHEIQFSQSLPLGELQEHAGTVIKEIRRVLTA